MNRVEKFLLAGIVRISSQLSVSDTSYFYDDPVLVNLPSGDYEVLVFCDEEDGKPYVQALKVVLGEAEAIMSEVIGHLNIDFGQVGICDRIAVEKAFDRLGDAGMQNYYDQLEGEDLFHEIRLPEHVKMISVQSGFGDGRYAVCALRTKVGHIVGVEVDFTPEPEGFR